MPVTPRSAVTLTYAAFGVMVGAQTGAIPVLTAQSGVDAFMFGVLASLAALANVTGLSLGGKVNRHFDHRSVLLFILPTVFLGLIFCLASHSIVVFGLSFMIFNLGTGLLDVFMNAEASSVEHDTGKPIFASFHAAVLYAMGAAGLACGFIATNYGPLWASLTTVPIVAAAIYAVQRAIVPCGVEKSDTAVRSAQLPRKILVLIGIIIGLDVAAEVTCVQWAGQVLSETQPALAEYSGLGLGFYGLCCGTVRLVGDRLRHRFSDIHLVGASFIIGMCGLIILATGPGFEISIFAFAITGCGLALIFPCLFSLAGRLAPQQWAAALGLVSGVSGPPRILMPALLGSMASLFGLHAIYAGAAAGACVALGFVYWMSVEIHKRNAIKNTPPQMLLHLRGEN